MLSSFWCSRVGKVAFQVFGACGSTKSLSMNLVVAACLENLFSGIWGAMLVCFFLFFSFYVFGARGGLQAFGIWFLRLEKFSSHVYGARGCYQVFGIWCARLVWKIPSQCVWCSRPVWKISVQVFGARGMFGIPLFIHRVLAACLQISFRYLEFAACLKNIFSCIWCSRLGNFSFHVFGARDLEFFISCIWCSQPVWNLSSHVFGPRGLVGKSSFFMYVVLAAWEIVFSCIWCSRLGKLSCQVFSARGVGNPLFEYLVLAACFPKSLRIYLQFGARGLFGRFSVHVFGAHV